VSDSSTRPATTSEAQKRSWASNRQQRRRAIALGCVRHYLDDHPGDGLALAIEILAAAAAAQQRVTHTGVNQ
jgi:hypothetical protein